MSSGEPTELRKARGWFVTLIPGHLTIALADQLIFTSSDNGNDFGLWSIDVPGETSASDIDGNGSVDFEDFLVLAANFGREVVGGRTVGDINEDGMVGFDDVLLLSIDFGKAP